MRMVLRGSIAPVLAVLIWTAAQNATADVPRTPEGRPDLSGLWNKSITVNSAAGIDLPFTPYGRERFEAAKKEVGPPLKE
jgi:hypothetical protein